MRVIRFLEAFGGLMLFLMMVITFLDVCGRYLAGRPFPGSTEIIQVLLALSVVTILPAITWHGMHISVGLFESGSAASRFERARRTAVAALGAMTFVALAWLLWGYAGQTATNRDVIGYLQLPVAPMVYAMAALSAVTASVFAAVALASARKTAP
jgi:TRAP-type C4-dicarboxylate transport system permease small subunit